VFVLLDGQAPVVGLENRAGLDRITPAQRSDRILHVGVELAESPAGPAAKQEITVMKSLA
jgi:hypothetical protein